LSRFWILAAANILSGLDLRDSYDGTGNLTDPLYDAANDAFLTQRIRLEALPGSAGLSTDLKMRIGRMAMLIDNSTINSPLPIRFGLGTVDVMNTDIGGTDGTIHATVEVATGGPGAVISVLTTSTTRPAVVMRTLVERRRSNQIPEIAQSPIVEPQPTSPATSSLRAVRRGIDSRAVDRVLVF
jgi:hypothetical protein